MLDAFGADQSVAERANAARIAAHYQNFEAVIVIEMDVKRGNDEVGVIVLQIGERALQRRFVMVEKQSDGARDFAAQTGVMLNQTGANHVGQRQRAIGIAFLRHHFVQLSRQSCWQRNTKAHRAFAGNFGACGSSCGSRKGVVGGICHQLATPLRAPPSFFVATARNAWLVTSFFTKEADFRFRPAQKLEFRAVVEEIGRWCRETERHR